MAQSFSQFDLEPEVQAGVARAGFTKPSAIQSAVLTAPDDLEQLVAIGGTGTGKTVAFGIKCMNEIARDRVTGLQTLILAPTPELCTQIAEALRAIAPEGVTVAVFAGERMNAARERGLIEQDSPIVVGTPGRILDLADREALDLDLVRTFVVDEIDEILLMGYREQLRRISAYLPEPDYRLTMFFSATLPDEARRFIVDELPDAEILDTRDSEPRREMQHEFLRVDSEGKRNLLVDLLEYHVTGRTIVFVNKKATAYQVGSHLEALGLRTAVLTGGMTDSARSMALRRFRASTIDVLVSSDVGGRGLDVSGVLNVVNYDLPDDAQTLRHRVGRTERLNTTGIAVTFVTKDDRADAVAFADHLDGDSRFRAGKNGEPFTGSGEDPSILRARSPILAVWTERHAYRFHRPELLFSALGAEKASVYSDESPIRLRMFGRELLSLALLDLWSRDIETSRASTSKTLASSVSANAIATAAARSAVPTMLGFGGIELPDGYARSHFVEPFAAICAALAIDSGSLAPVRTFVAECYGLTALEAGDPLVGCRATPVTHNAFRASLERFCRHRFAHLAVLDTAVSDVLASQTDPELPQLLGAQILRCAVAAQSRFDPRWDDADSDRESRRMEQEREVAAELAKEISAAPISLAPSILSESLRVFAAAALDPNPLGTDSDARRAALRLLAAVHTDGGWLSSGRTAEAWLDRE